MKLTCHLALVFCSLVTLITCVEADDVTSSLAVSALPTSEGAFVASLGRIDLSVYALGYADDLRTVYFLDDEGQETVIALSTAEMVGPYEIVLDANSNVILRNKEETAEGTTIYPSIAEVKIPSQIKEPVMILAPSTEGLPYQAIIIDQSLEGVPLGSYLLINLSSMEMRGLVGSHEIAIAAEGVAIVDLSSESGDLLDVHLELKDPTGWKTFARTRWVNELSKRSLLVTFIDTETKRIKVRGVAVRLPSLEGDTAR